MLSAPLRLLLLPLLAAGLSCCTPLECQPESLPHEGQPRDSEELFRVAQYAARQDCDQALYGLLSAATQDEIGSLTFQLFWASMEIPEFEYALRDVIAKGTFGGMIPGPDPEKPHEAFAYIEYEEPGRGNLFAQILIVKEPNEDGEVRARIGLQDQADLIEAGDYRYYWDAGR